MWREFVKDYFTFTRKERKGIFILISLIIIFSGVPLIYPLLLKEEAIDFSPFAQEVADFESRTASNDSITKESRVYGKRFAGEESHAYELFYFDPNTASVQDWLRLGVREKTARTIQKYLAKGGRFKKPEDIRRIYGLGKQDVDRIISYVRIESPEKRAAQQEPFSNKAAYKESITKIIKPVEINQADSNALIGLPGIGSRLAYRIINFRDKLGGFHSIDQVKETYLLPETTFYKIKPLLTLNPSSIKKIDINAGTAEQLRAHPYISNQVATGIVRYREQHGNFSSLEDLKKIMIISEDVFGKISPYLTVTGSQ